MLRRVSLVRNIPEDTILHSNGRENLKSYTVCVIIIFLHYIQFKSPNS
jgi:hypothetical protein